MIKKFGYFLCVMLLGGCFGGYSPKSTFYTLSSLENVPPLSNKSISVGVGLPELPEYVDRPQIVSFLKNSSQINIDETNRWGDNLDEMMQRIIAGDLSAYLPKSTIKSKTSLIERYKFEITVSVIKFDMIEKRLANFEANWSIKNGNSLDVIYSGKTSLNRTINKSYNSYIEAMSEMIGQMSKEIAQQLIKY